MTLAGGVFGPLTLGGLTLALGLTVAVFAILLGAVRPALRATVAPSPLRWLGLGGGISFLVAAAAFSPAITVVQMPLQAALNRWMMANLATANQAVLLLPAILMSGLVQEPVKLLAALAGTTPAGLAGRAVVSQGGGAGPATVSLAIWRAVALGAAAGAGFGGIEAALFLSPVFGAQGSPLAVGGGLLVAAAIVERFSAIMFHVSTTGMAAYAWTRGPGRGLATLGILSLIHGLYNYFAVLVRAPGPWAIVIPQAFYASVSAGLLVYLVALLRREARKGTANS
jgi:hypothetical protein